MKYFVIIITYVFFSSNISLANESSQQNIDDIHIIRRYIENEFENETSATIRQINDLLDINHFPKNRVYNLFNLQSLLVGNKQIYSECSDVDCVLYERNFYTQLADIRSIKIQTKISQINVQLIGINIYIMRKWRTSLTNEKVELIFENISNSNIIFY